MSDFSRDARLALFEHIPLPVQIWRLEEPDALRVIAANPASERVFGVGARAAGSTVEEGFPALRDTGIREMGARVVRTGEPATMGEARVAGPGGAARMKVRAFPLGEGCVGLAFEDAGSPEEELEPSRRARDLALAALDCVPDIVFVKSKDHTYVLMNKMGGNLLGKPASTFVGKTNQHLFPDDVSRSLEELDAKIVAGREPYTYEETLPMPGGGLRTYLTTKTPLYDEGGGPLALVGVARDVTEARRAEEALRKSLAELEAVRAELLGTVRELSTPVLPIHDGVLVLPLIGKLSSERGDQFSDALLSGIQRHRAHTVIIDITGVQVVDTAVATHLVQATRAASLLGAECVLVGIAPQVAGTLVQIGVDFGPLVLRGDLQAGITYALDRQKAR